MNFELEVQIQKSKLALSKHNADHDEKSHGNRDGGGKSLKDIKEQRKSFGDLRDARKFVADYQTKLKSAGFKDVTTRHAAPGRRIFRNEKTGQTAWVERIGTKVSYQVHNLRGALDRGGSSGGRKGRGAAGIAADVMLQTTKTSPYRRK